MQELLAAEGFADHPDHNTEHGGPAVQKAPRCSCCPGIWAAAAAAYQQGGPAWMALVEE